MKEITNLRKENEKHFLCDDGSIKAYCYKESIHYLDNGEYKDIDNTLVLNGNFYQNKANDFKVFFVSCKDNSLLYKIEKNNHYIEFGLTALKSDDCKIIVDKNTIKYNNAYNNIDYIYEVIGKRVKETIILKSSETCDLKFLIRTNLNLVLKDNTIQAYNGDKIIYNFTPPFMYDYENNKNSNIIYDLEKRDGYYVLSLILDMNWLKTAKLPVCIDPTVTTVKTQVHDTYIYPGDTGIDKNSEDCLKIGVDENNVIYRALLKFDLPDLTTGAEIINAQVNLCSHGNDLLQNAKNPVYEIITAHEVISDWNETTATWDNMHDKYNPSVESSNMFFKTTISDEDHSMREVKTNSVNITSLAKRWYQGNQNNGIMLKFLNEEYNPECNYYQEYSNDHKLTDRNDIKPFLSIQYINTGGISSYRQYDNYSFKNGTAYLDLYNGGLTVLFNINNTLGGKFPIELNAVINNSFIESTDNKKAHTWKFSLFETITKETEKFNQIDRECIHYIDSTNKTTSFYKVKDEDNQIDFYQNEEGFNLKLTEEDNKFIITDKDGNVKTFTKKGEIYYLTKITNVEKNEINIIFNDNNQIIKVIDGNNQEISITYTTDKVIIISPEKTSEIQLENENISKIITKSGITNVEYTKFTQTVISKITDENGIGLSFSYNQDETSISEIIKKVLSGLIYKVTELGVDGVEGQSFRYKYGFNTTKVTNDKNQTYTYIFNNLGICIGTTLMDSSGKLSESYGFNQKFIDLKGNKKNNKLISETPPIKFVNNLLSNTSFENNETSNIIYGGTRSTEQARTGKYSYKGEFIECQFRDYNTNLERGKEYTFSGYIKCNSSFTITVYTRNPNKIIKTEKITYAKSTDFQQVYASFTYPANPECYIDIEIAFINEESIYLDDIQLEKGLSASKYNLIENSCFQNGITNWVISANNIDTGEEYLNSYSIVDINDSEKALEIKSKSDCDICASYDFSFEGKKGDVYHLSFWYKDQGLYNEEAVTEMEGNKANIQFFFKDQLMGIGTHNIVFNKHSDEWQFFSESFIAEEDYEGFSLNILSLLESNSLYITNVMLVKELGEYTYDYDEEGNLISSKDLSGNESQLKYDTNNQLIGAFNPKGNNFKYEYDNTVHTRVLKGISPTGISNEIEYDTFGNPIKTLINNVNPNGVIEEDKYYQFRLKGTKNYIDINFDLNKITLKNDDCNHKAFKLIKVTESHEKNVDGEIFTITDEYYRLNYFDKYITFANESLYISKNLDDTTLFKLTPLNNASYILTPKNEQARIKDGMNIQERCITIKDDNTVSVEIRDRENSRQQFYLEDTNTNKFIESTSEYTEDGKFITKMVDSLGKETLYDIDPTTGLTKSITSPKQVLTEYTYNTKDQVKTITNNEKTIIYDYNDKDLLSKITSGNKKYNFEYDKFLNTKKIDINGQTLVTNNFEKKNGNLLSSTYGNGHSVLYTYDKFNRLETYTTDNKTYKNIYNSIGNLAQISEGLANHYYFYDFANRLSKYLFSDIESSFEIKYDFDKNGNVTNKNYNLFDELNTELLASKLEYAYNQDDSIIKVSFDNHSLNNTYDYLGRLEKKSIDDNLNIEYTYYGRGNKTSLTVKSIKIDENIYEYKYDDLYNIIDIYLNGELTNHYEYDLFNQLVEDKNYILNKKYTFEYNTEGNILSKKEYDLETNSLLHEDTYEYSNTNWEDQLTKFNNETITYDEIGNPVTIGNKTLTWKNGRQLNSFNDTNNNLSVTYDYNKDGIRTKKTINNITTKYYVEGTDIVVAKTGNNMLYFIRDDAGSLIGFKYNGTMYYYIKNLQEDIIGIKDAEFNLVANYTYDAWGKIVSVTDAEGNKINDSTHIAHLNPFRYRSYYYDEETGLYYLNSRYYNPEWGRFINADEYITTEQGILSYNMYLYTENNPINRFDFLGNSGISIAIFLAVCTGVAVVLQKIYKYDSSIKELILAGLTGFSGALVAAAGFGNIATIALTSILTLGIDIRFNYSPEKNYANSFAEEIIINSITSIIPSHNPDTELKKAILSHTSSTILGNQLSEFITVSSSPSLQNSETTPISNLNKQNNIPNLNQNQKTNMILYDKNSCPGDTKKTNINSCKGNAAAGIALGWLF